jgi:N,N'-diacetyllegionaminate synthase
LDAIRNPSPGVYVPTLADNQTMTEFAIAGRSVGAGSPTYLIAEIAQAHDGSLGAAHAHVEAAAEAGADAVKFQTHIAAAESTRDEPFRIAFSRQDAMRYDYWQRTGFSEDQWAGLAVHAADRGLSFLSSPFSREAVEMLRWIGVPAWKVASGEVNTVELLDEMVAGGEPVLLSTGMSGFADIDDAVATLRQAGVPFAVMQCTSRYPTAYEDVGLNVIEELASRYGCPAGLSDHSGKIYPGLAAIARGAAVVEVHLTLSRRAFGPDAPVSLTVEEFAELAAMRDAVHRMDANPVDKDTAAERLAGMRTLFGRSLAPREALVPGTVLTAEMLVPKKPASGIPVTALDAVIGRRVLRPVAADRLLTYEDLDAGI